MKNNIHIIFGASIVFALLSLIFSNFSIFIVGFICFFVLFMCFNKNRIGKVLFAVIIIQCILLLVTYYGYLSKYGKPYYLGGSDDLDFEELAIKCVENRVYTFNQASHTDPIMFSDGKTYVLFLSYLMRFSSFFGGYHTISARLVNLLMLDFVAGLVFSLLSKNNKRMIVFLLITLFPSCIYISVHVFRDVVSCFFLVFLYYILQKIDNKGLKLYRKFFLILVCAMISYLAYYNRKMNIVYIGLVIGLWLINHIGNEEKYRIVKFAAFSLVFAVLAGFLGYLKVFSNYNDNYSTYITGKNSGIANYVFSLPMLPFGFIVRIVYGVFFPSPATLLQFYDMFVDIDVFWKIVNAFGTILQVSLFVKIISKIKYFNDYFIIAIVVFLSIVFTTLGFRHFIYFYPFFFAASFSSRQKSKKKEYSLGVKAPLIKGSYE